MPLGLGLKQLVPSGARPFVYINDMYYDSSSNLVWVADMENTNPVIPVMSPTSNSTYKIVNTSPMGWGTGGAGYGYQGAKQLTADSNYVYASNYNNSNTIAIISKSTFAVVGILNATYGGQPHGGPITASNGNGLFMAGGGTLSTIAYEVNILGWSPTAIANAITNFPTSQAPDLVNRQTYAWPSSSGIGLWNAITIGYNPSTDQLFCGTDNGVAGSPPGSVANEALFAVTRSGLTLSTATLYTKSSGYAYSIFEDTTYAGGSFNNIISSLSERSPTSPNYTFGTTTAQIYSGTGPFVTLPITPNPPYALNAAVYRTTHDDVNDTLFVMFTQGQSGAGMEVARYNSSGTLVSTFGDSTVYPGQNEITQTVATTSSTIWFSRFYEVFSPFKLISSILVFTSTIGSESKVIELSGY